MRGSSYKALRKSMTAEQPAVVDGLNAGVCVGAVQRIPNEVNENIDADSHFWYNGISSMSESSSGF